VSREYVCAVDRVIPVWGALTLMLLLLQSSVGELLRFQGPSPLDTFHLLPTPTTSHHQRRVLKERRVEKYTYRSHSAGTHGSISPLPLPVPLPTTSTAGPGVPPAPSSPVVACSSISLTDIDDIDDEREREPLYTRGERTIRAWPCPWCRWECECVWYGCPWRLKDSLWA
jgi:hypothetical protein